MPLDNLIIFTHIPKTSGTSFQKSLVETNVNDNQIYIYKNLKKFIQEHNRYKFVVGHVPYGLHYFTNKKVKYITFLRDPIERAVSFYFFIKDSDTRFYKHPLRDYADSVTLEEFYKNKKFQNQQTRFISGFISDRIYPSVSSPGLDKLVLNTAISHLKNNYCCFGILEKFDESIAKFQNKFEWEKYVEVNHHKKTGKRPKLSDLDRSTLDSLRKSNGLDLQFYEFAFNYFQQF